MSEFNQRLIAVLNKSIAPGKAMNALAHMSIGLGANLGPNLLELMSYKDLDGNGYPNISKMPFIILKANSNKIKNLYHAAQEQQIKATVFTDTMTVGSWQAQLDRTASSPHLDLNFYGIVMYGGSEILTELTKKLSLWT